MQPFKTWINPTVIESIALQLTLHWPSFEKNAFILAACDQLEQLELKGRTAHLTEALRRFLPNDFQQTASILLEVLGPELGEAISGGQVNEQGIGGWSLMAFADYVSAYGQHEFELSMQLLFEITKRGSAEFAIRPFLLKQQTRTLQALAAVVHHPDHHVRRLVSEGSRPRLPWGCQLPAFIRDPAPVLPLLEQLRDDESLYVRRSVANHLNDIAKDHPELVADVAEAWFDRSKPERIRLLRHACRTLLKQDHRRVLALFGYHKPSVINIKSQLSPTVLAIGESLEIELSMTSEKAQQLMLDYVVHLRRKNGQLHQKVFKWSKRTLGAGDVLAMSKKHSFKAVTTRRYYPGLHTIDIKANGVVIASHSFKLTTELGHKNGGN